MKNNNPVLTFQNLNLVYSDKTILNGISGSVLPNDRIGLVGINGAGKSTLLKVICGIIKPHAGSLSNFNHVVEYVSQIDLEQYRADTKIFRYIQSKHENWWDTLLKYEENFSESSKIKETNPISSLSGGEIIKLNIAIALSKNPDLLLLDEPTNHLDSKSRKDLIKVLDNLNIPYIVVSHDISFLNQTTNQTWELENGKLNVYGGNYEFYKNWKEEEQDSLERQYLEKVKEKKKLVTSARQVSMQRERNRNSWKKETGKIDKFAKGYFGNRSEKNSGQHKQKVDKKLSELDSEINNLKKVSRKKTYLNINHNTKRGLILSIETSILKIDNKELFEIKDFYLYHSDRISISGRNGSGKTTFVKNLVYQANLNLTQVPKYGQQYTTLFVDQKYDIVNPEQTLVRNIKNSNPKLNNQEMRKILSNFEFRNKDDVHKLGKHLSGGELARLAFAMATSREIDLLVLDEPTNNLDIDTKDVISSALREFEGTLVVISHDEQFLEDVGIDIRFKISCPLKSERWRMERL